MHRLHIVNVCFTGRSGLTDYTLSLARALATHCRSTIVSARDFDYPRVRFDGEVLRLFRRSRHYPLDLLRFVGWAWRTKPDIIVFQAPLKLPFFDGLVARLLRKRGIRMATTVHDVLPHYPAAWSPLIFRFFYRSFDLLVAHGNVAKVQLRQLGINTPLTVVPHGVYDIYRTVGMSRSEARTHFHDLKSDDFVVLFFGHVDERKGIDELLRCWQNPGINKGLKLIIAGRCAITDTKVLQRYQSAQSDPRFIVINRRVPFEDVEPLFEACDAVVLPYLEGTTSGVLKLAMAFAKPVIATDIGDLPETIQVEAGIIISHKSVLEDLPRALARLREHYPSYQANWRTVSAEYGWPAIAAHYYEFLTDGIDNSAERINASTSILE